MAISSNAIQYLDSQPCRVKIGRQQYLLKYQLSYNQLFVMIVVFILPFYQPNIYYSY